jgi:hypothetical protein
MMMMKISSDRADYAHSYGGLRTQDRADYAQ